MPPEGWSSTRPTESVDVAPTVLEWLGGELPVQFDGWPLTSFLHVGAAPAHWRAAAHWEWDFRHPQYRYAERRLGIPGEHCCLAVARTAEAKYVQFATGPDVLPALLFDLAADPGHRVNLAAGPAPAARAAATADGNLRLELELAQEMLRWQMRNRERTLTNCYLVPGTGPVWPGTRGVDQTTHGLDRSPGAGGGELVLSAGGRGRDTKR